MIKQQQNNQRLNIKIKKNKMYHHHKRHYVTYIIEDVTNNILVLSILHDSMDLAQHLGLSNS